MGNTPNQAEISSGSVAKEMRPTMQLAQQQADALKKPDDTAKADQEHAAKAAVDQQQQREAVKEAPRTLPLQEDRTPRRSRPERAFDKTVGHLETYRDAKIGSLDKAVALQRLVETVVQHPKKNILDKVYEFFKENKNEEFLKETNALQNITSLTPDIKIRVELLYHLMYSLARGEATRRTISIDAIRDVFKSDDIANWVATTMRNSYRR